MFTKGQSLTLITASGTVYAKPAIQVKYVEPYGLGFEDEHVVLYSDGTRVAVLERDLY